MKKGIKIVIISLVSLILMVIGIGLYKLAFIQDDIYYCGTAIDSNNIDMFYGSWIESGAENKQYQQGFVLKKDGSARSINMATLQYQHWWFAENKLVLVAESIGNGISFLDTSAYEIVAMNRYKMQLKYGEQTIDYEKE